MKETLERQLTIRMSNTLYNKLTRVSKSDNISLGNLCRRLIIGGLKNEENKSQKNNRQKNL